MTDDEQQRRFEDTFRSNFDALLAYAVARVDLESAKDAVASAFLVAWRRRAEIPDPGLPWLIGVVRRTLADQRRNSERSTSLAKKLAAQPETLVGADDQTGPPTADDVLVVSALRELSERDQELLRLVAWDGLTNAEIAEALRACEPGEEWMVIPNLHEVFPVGRRFRPPRWQLTAPFRNGFAENCQRSIQ